MVMDRTLMMIWQLAGRRPSRAGALSERTPAQPTDLTSPPGYRLRSNRPASRASPLAALTGRTWRARGDRLPERLLPMQDRRVGAGGIIEAVDLASAERKLHAAEEGRVRVGLEIGINEVRNLARLAVRDHGGGRL